jgi:hypothetical protein
MEAVLDLLFRTHISDYERGAYCLPIRGCGMHYRGGEGLFGSLSRLGAFT